MAQKKYVSIAKLGLYDEQMKKHVADADAEVLAAAKKHAEDLGANYDVAGSAATVQGKLDEEAGRAKAEEERIAGLVSTAQGEVDALEEVVAGKASQADLDTHKEYVGTFTHESAKTVVEYINAKTDGIATSGNLEALGQRVTVVEGKVSTIEGDYLKGADKTELEDKINVKADQTSLDEVAGVANAAVKQADYDVKVKALEDEDVRIVGLVEAEAERAAKAEDELEKRIETMEVFWDATEDNDGIVNKLKEIQDYIAGDESGAAEMAGNIQANTQAIAEHVALDHDFAGADAALKAELEGKINGKADSSVVTELSGKMTVAEGKISANEQAIASLQEAIGDNGSVDSMIDGAISAAMEAEVERVDGLLDGKVDKVDGKGLSTNDLTNELKGQYDTAYAHSQVVHAPADAQANVIESVKVNGVALTVTGKAVDVSVPTDNSQLTNGAGYLVANDVANKADKATTLAGYGIVDAYTSAQTDTAIANAMAQFVECSEEEIMALFQ